MRTLTYAQLGREVARLANGLKRLGVGLGDRVGIFLPMSQEAAIAVVAVSRIGAVYVPCFSGYGAGAVAARLEGCEARVLITADAFMRRGHVVAMKQTADEAVAQCPTIEKVVVVRYVGEASGVTMQEGRDVWWHEQMRVHPNGWRGAPLTEVVRRFGL